MLWRHNHKGLLVQDEILTTFNPMLNTNTQNRCVFFSNSNYIFRIVILIKDDRWNHKRKETERMLISWFRIRQLLQMEVPNKVRNVVQVIRVVKIAGRNSRVKCKKEENWKSNQLLSLVRFFFHRNGDNFVVVVFFFLCTVFLTWKLICLANLKNNRKAYSDFQLTWESGKMISFVTLWDIVLEKSM